MLDTIDHRVNVFKKWLESTRSILLPKAPVLGRLKALKDLVDEAEELKLPNGPLLRQLREEYTNVKQKPEPIIIDLLDDD